jgi:hypothetical protein
LEMTVSPDGHILLDAQSRGGGFLNDYQIAANIVAPSGETQSVILNQIAPGRYSGDFSPDEQGVYLFNLSGKQDGDALVFSQTTGWALSYSPEYQRLDSNPDLLTRLVALTNGKIASSDPGDVFTHDLKSTRGSRPIWPWLLLIAALLLPFDIAVRRLIITKQDLAKIREWIVSRVKIQSTAQEPIQADPRMQALRKAKERTIREPVQIEPSTMIEKEETLIPPIQSAPKQEENKSTTSALLERKRNSRK